MSDQFVFFLATLAGSVLLQGLVLWVYGLLLIRLMRSQTRFNSESRIARLGKRDPLAETACPPDPRKRIRDLEEYVMRLVDLSNNHGASLSQYRKLAAEARSMMRLD